MPFVTPFSAIGTIQRGNQLAFDSAATQASVELLRRLLLARQTELHLSGELVVPDSLRAAAAHELDRAVTALANRTQLAGGAHLPVLHQLLRQQGQRYALISVARGFTRTGDNYSGQLAKSIGIGLLSMGTIIPVSVKAKSEINVFVYDSQQQAIVYLSRTPPPAEREPLNEAGVEKQFRNMLGSDYRFVSRP